MSMRIDLAIRKVMIIMDFRNLAIRKMIIIANFRLILNVVMLEITRDFNLVGCLNYDDYQNKMISIGFENYDN